MLVLFACCEHTHKKSKKRTEETNQTLLGAVQELFVCDARFKNEDERMGRNPDIRTPHAPLPVPLGNASTIRLVSRHTALALLLSCT